jgi:hypothetical protein
MQIPDNFAYVIFVDEHDLLHTADHPFCWNSTCQCHEDQEAIVTVQQYISDGLMTTYEATLLVSGRTV